MCTFLLSPLQSSPSRRAPWAVWAVVAGRGGVAVSVGGAVFPSAPPRVHLHRKVTAARRNQRGARQIQSERQMKAFLLLRPTEIAKEGKTEPC